MLPISGERTDMVGMDSEPGYTGALISADVSSDLPMRIFALAAFALTLLLGRPASARDLMGVYRDAYQNDPQLRAAQYDTEAARELRPQARALLLPAVSVSGTVNRTHTETDTHLSVSPQLPSAVSVARAVGNGTTATASLLANTLATNIALQQNKTIRTDTNVTRRELALTLTQPLYRRDRWIQLRQTDDVIAQSKAQLTAEDQGLMLRTASAYFDVLSARDGLELAQAERTAIERQLDQAKQRFEVGLIAITGVHESQARFDQARANEIAARNELDNALEALREITGMSEERGALSALSEDLPLKMPVPADIEQWAEFAIKQNPAVIAAEHATESARKDIEVRRSGHYPTLDLVGGLSTSRTESGTDVNTDDASIGLQLAVPLYAGGGVVAGTREARFAFEAATERLDQERRAVKRQVRDAYRGVESNISRVKALQAAIVSAESALEATRAGYDVGTRTIVDVLDAESELYRAKREFSKARYDYIVNGIALKQAAGTLAKEDLESVNGLLAQ